jgi:hypothetical protein
MISTIIKKITGKEPGTWIGNKEMKKIFVGMVLLITFLIVVFD